MNENEALARAIKIAAEAFEKSMDKGGSPYILHCLAVMDGVKHLGFKVMTAAVLHDLLEDCPDWNSERLKQEGFCDEVISLIKAVTHPQDEAYELYIDRVATYPEAKAIKMADLMHNMNLTRLSALNSKTIERIKKYHNAYGYLKLRTAR
jgi:(p)ppGpp synthase/HD superfamily hydrolase